MNDVDERMRQLLRDRAEDIPSFREMPPRLKTRARRRVALTFGAAFVAVMVLVVGAFTGVRSLTSQNIPADRPVEPRPSPAVSGSLVYALGDNIYVADPDGSNAVRITDVAAIDCPGDVAYSGPLWSPDGRYIASLVGSACSSVGPGTDGPVPGVVIMDPQGNVVANFPVQERWRAWSPDSTRVAVWDEYSPGAFTIGIYGIDGTRQTQIALPPGWRPADLGVFAWTQDGASLIVDQFEMPLDGGTPRELPFPFVRPQIYSPSGSPVIYSPDGSQVAYATRSALMVARPDGSEPREVFGDAPYDATWSPTGKLIAVTADAPGGNAMWPPNQLHVVDVATGSATLVFEGERRAILYVIGFSPEGDRVLFSSFEKGESLWSVGVDGSDARLVVAGTSDGEWLSR